MTQRGFPATIIGEFSGGLVTALSPLHIPVNSLQLCYNFDLTSVKGAARVRSGFSTESSKNFASGGNVGTLYEYIKEGGESYLIMSFGGNLYSVFSPNVFTQINSAAVVPGRVGITTFKNTLIFLTNGGAPHKWSGTGISNAILGSPPTDGVDIEVFKERVFICSKNRIYYSAIDNFEDWTTPGENGAGSFSVASNDGGVIKRIISYGPNLYIFKDKAIYVLSGSKPSNFTIRQLSGSVGLISDRAVNRAPAFLIFLARDGVYAIGDGVLAVLSRNVEKTIQEIDTQTATACSGVLGNKYFLYVKSLDSGVPKDEIYTLDYQSGIWSKYTINVSGVTYPIDCFMSRRSDNALLAGMTIGGTNAHIIMFGFSDNDSISGTNPINATLRTKELWVSGWDIPKKRIIAYIIWKNIKSSLQATLRASLYVNGVLQSDSTNTFTDTVGNLRVDRAVFPAVGQNIRTVSIEVDNGGALNSKFEVYGISVEMDESEDRR